MVTEVLNGLLGPQQIQERAQSADPRESSAVRWQEQAETLWVRATKWVIELGQHPREAI